MSDSAAPPLPFPAFGDVIEGNFKKSITFGDLTFSSTFDPPASIVGSPIATTVEASKNGGISVDVKLEMASAPLSFNTTLSSENSNSWASWVPTLRYRLPITVFCPAKIFRQSGEGGGKGQRCDAAPETSWLSCNPVKQEIGAEFTHAAYRASLTTKFLDGLATSFVGSLRWEPNVFAGLSFRYDPSRSGLQHYRWGFLFLQRPEVRNGDVSVSYDAKTGAEVGIAIPVKSSATPRSVAVVARPGQRELVVGGLYTSPCGHAQLRGAVEFLRKRSAELFLTKTFAQRHQVTFGIRTSWASPKPQFGVAITQE